MDMPMTGKPDSVDRAIYDSFKDGTSVQKKQQLSGYTLRRSEQSRTFLCSECRREKTCKSFATAGEGKLQSLRLMCNGCYGTAVSKVKAVKVQSGVENQVLLHSAQGVENNPLPTSDEPFNIHEISMMLAEAWQKTIGREGTRMLKDGRPVKMGKGQVD